jgi:chromosome segregation protein
MSSARLELDRLAQTRVHMTEKLARDRQAFEESEQLRVAEEQKLESARQDLVGLQAELARANEEHASLRANLASLEARRQSMEGAKSRLETQTRDIGRQKEQLIRQSEELIANRERLIASNEELRVQSSELAHAIDAMQSRVAALAQQETALRNELATADEELKARRLEAQQAQERRGAFQVALARADSEKNHLEETSQRELGTPAADLTRREEILIDEMQLADIEGKYEELRRRIEALGPINSEALEEYEQAQQRQEFLNAQRQDLLDSIRDIEKAIQDINRESRNRFAEAFEAINMHFREMFRILFGGGVGEMRLTDEENVGESGIDIVASPPGKKLQNILLLSGGEKSLTAMALLMAIFHYTPSPFCILDEVDAPLDEANIERLTRLLREMSEQTQFIVITHAKRTMEAAQALYGVTMQEPGISKLVSVKFNQQQAAGHRPVKRNENLEAAIA